MPHPDPHPPGCVVRQLQPPLRAAVTARPGHLSLTTCCPCLHGNQPHCVCVWLMLGWTGVGVTLLYSWWPHFTHFALCDPFARHCDLILHTVTRFYTLNDLLLHTLWLCAINFFLFSTLSNLTAHLWPCTLYCVTSLDTFFDLMLCDLILSSSHCHWVSLFYTMWSYFIHYDLILNSHWPHSAHFTTLCYTPLPCLHSVTSFCTFYDIVLYTIALFT